MSAKAAKLLLDADAVSKLAYWELLAEVPSLFEVDWNACATLESVHHRARKAASGARDKLFPTRKDGAYAVEHLKQMLPLPEPSDRIFKLQEIPQLDAGEAILMAVAADQNALVVSGDKRAMVAIGSHVRTSGSTDFDQRCICLEQILLMLLRSHGIEWLRRKICPRRGFDKAIDIIFGSQCDAHAEQVEQGLKSYINSLLEGGRPAVRCG